MFHCKCFTVNPVGENCYILWDDISHDGAVIDCGAWTEIEKRLIGDFIGHQGIAPKYSLQTHMHFDHCLGLGFINMEYGLTPLCHPADMPVYKSAPDMVRQWFGIDISSTIPQVATDISEATVLHLGDVDIHVLHTPGHTPGGVCYHIPSARILFTGDTLFRGSVGRTDLPGGDSRQELDSIREKILVLPADTIVMPGHGPESTVREEMESNPYLT